MILGYSPRMEHLVGSLLKGPERKMLSAGVAFCSLWNDSILLGSMKVIAVVSEEAFFDEADFLNGFEKLLLEAKGKDEVPFFAEKFGYRRFCVPYETDDPLQLRRVFSRLPNVVWTSADPYTAEGFEATRTRGFRRLGGFRSA